jgi:hypothetical protein
MTGTGEQHSIGAELAALARALDICEQIADPLERHELQRQLLADARREAGRLADVVWRLIVADKRRAGEGVQRATGAAAVAGGDAGSRSSGGGHGGLLAEDVA